MGFLQRVAKAVTPDTTDVPRPGGDLGGVPGRAVVIRKLGHASLEKHETPRYINVDFEARLVGRAGGPPIEIRAYVAPRAAVILWEGLEVPVRVDRVSGAVLGLDGDAWEAEAEKLDELYEAQGGRVPRGGPPVESGP